MSRIILLLPFLFMACKSNPIEVEENRMINLGHDRLTSEGFLSKNPGNSQHLIGAFLTAEIQEKGYDYYTEVIVSRNGGESWESTNFKHLPEAADPWCVLTTKGNAIVSDISEGSKFHLTTQFSSDGGTRWQDTISFGFGHDHSMLLYNDSKGPFAGQVYLISTQQNTLLIARSPDEGQSFPVINRYRLPDSLDINAKTPVVLSDGTLVLPFITRASKPMKSFLLSSKDGGKIFTKPTLITQQNGRRHHILAVNKAPLYTDFLYYVFVGLERNGIFLTRSEDRGQSWSAPQRLDNNQRQAPWSDLGAVSISPKGIIGVLWTERTDEQCFDKYFIASIDGGKSFLSKVKINDRKSCPDASNGWVGKAWPQGGDYLGLVSIANGAFLAMWSDARTGKFKLYSTTIKVKT